MSLAEMSAEEVRKSLPYEVGYSIGSADVTPMERVEALFERLKKLEEDAQAVMILGWQAGVIDDYLPFFGQTLHDYTPEKMIRLLVHITEFIEANPPEEGLADA